MTITFTPSLRIWITVGIGTLLAGGAIFFFITPQREQVKELREDITEKRILLATLYKEHQNLSALTSDIEFAEDKLTGLEKTTLSPDRSLEFISELERYADETPIQQTISLAPVSPSDDLQHIPTEIRLQSTFEKTLTYLSRLERSPYYLGVTRIEMTPITSDELLTTLTAETYWIDKNL